MTDLVLYYDDASPPVRSCLMLIKMLKLDVRCEHVDLFKGEQFSESFLQLNPAHTVPVLKHGSLILTDSHAIMMYLCEKYKAHQLFPIDLEQRIVVTNMLFLECSVVFRRDSDFLSDVFRKGITNIDLPYYEKKIYEVYNILEKILENQNKLEPNTPNANKYMCGSQLTIADISLLTTCSTLDMMIPINAELTKCYLLEQWLNLMKQLPEYAINAKGLHRLRAVMQSMGKSS